MRVENSAPVKYYLQLEDEEIYMNELLGNEVRILYSGIINCVACGRLIKKAFGQGFCYPCFINSPLNSECILKPELCLAHKGIGRDPDWEELNHNKPHIVYLALTSGIKVGVTREDQIPVRWIDQGAWKTIKLARTPYRQLAGAVEINLKNHLSDKTNWQKMLKDEMAHSIDILSEKIRIIDLVNTEFKEYLIPEDDEVFIFEYPVLNYPQKIKSINLDNDPLIQDVLTGIRAQYLIFKDGRVINLRKYSGYEVEFMF